MNRRYYSFIKSFAIGWALGTMIFTEITRTISDFHLIVGAVSMGIVFYADLFDNGRNT